MGEETLIEFNLLKPVWGMNQNFYVRHLAKFKHSVSEQVLRIFLRFGLKFLPTDILRP